MINIPSFEAAAKQITEGMPELWFEERGEEGNTPDQAWDLLVASIGSALDIDRHDPAEVAYIDRLLAEVFDRSACEVACYQGLTNTIQESDWPTPWEPWEPEDCEVLERSIQDGFKTR